MSKTVKPVQPLAIALIGYGKMGKTIEEIALQRGHRITHRIHRENLGKLTAENLKTADVAIEFTSPEAALENIRNCITWKVPVVSGSTGWTAHLDEMKSLCEKNQGSFIYSSNFSIGVNIFFEVNKKLASLMTVHEEYDVDMEEIHHTQKKDAPSGTAISLAEQIIANLPRKRKWVCQAPAEKDELMITSLRIDPAPGTHKVKYHSPIDDIEIVHTAHNRAGFAAGAVLAAEFLKGKQGFFTMQQVLGF